MTIRAARIAALAFTLLLAAAVAGLWPAGPGQPPPAAAWSGHSIFDSISITSNPGTDKNYVAGDTITVRIRFSSGHYSASHASLRLKIQVGANERTVSIPDAGTFFNPVNGSSLTFNYTVTAADNDQDGISVATNALSGTLRHWHGTGSHHTNPNTLPNTLATAQSGHRVNFGTDYDDDNDNLIEVSDLAELDAIRYDLNGNGARDTVSTTDWARWQAAFADGIPGMGCPATCKGYELRADLDFDTDGDGSTHTNGVGDDDDDYNNSGGTGAGWNPIGGVYTGAFDGNGHTIDNLFITKSAAGFDGVNLGLFRELGGTGVITTLGVRNAYITYSGNAETSPVGILVGKVDGDIKACYTTGYVRGYTHVGGLAGRLNSSGASIEASYSTATVSAGAGNSGGLVGIAWHGTITGSYYGGSSVTGSGAGGLVGAHSSATISNSYWHRSPGGVPNTSPGSPNTAGKTTAELQNPAGYTDIYASWNRNLDGQAGGDYPWEFGAGDQFPVLKYGGHTLERQGRTRTDYDDNNDGLLEITTLAQLDAIRYDLDGGGDQDDATRADWEKYGHAFPNAMAGMGCPLTDHDSSPTTPEQPTCTGYELRADLDFDTDGDGSTHTGRNGDGDDAYNNGGRGWIPIGGAYNATFDGNGHTIDNLFIKTTTADRYDIGLFRQLGGSSGVITTLGVRNAYITNTGTVSAAASDGGILVGENSGAIVAAYTTGYVEGNEYIGGLVGEMTGGSIQASYSTATVRSQNEVGGLVGQMGAGNITGSYYAGSSITSVSRSTARGGLVGQRTGSATIAADSYWNKDPGGVPDSSAGSQNTAGKTTTELQNPTGYTGIYAAWNSNLDGQTGNDDPWDFGASDEYPVLKYGGHKPTDQGRTLKDYDDNGNGLIDLRTLAQLDAIRYDLDGNGAVSATNRNQYRAAFPNAAAGMGCPLTDHDGDSDTAEEPTCTGYELRNSLDFDQNNDDTITAADGDAGYWNGGAGWVPIGGHSSTALPFTAIFEGNDHTISNLYISLSTNAAADAAFVGLFADIGATNAPGVVRNVGLVAPNVSNTRTAAGGNITYYTGALAGRNSTNGTVRGSRVAGGSVAATQNTATASVLNYAGCLLGQNAGTVSGSSASCAASATGNATNAFDYAGGLIGRSQGAVIGSYATGTATADNVAGGLVGESAFNDTVTASYATGAVEATGGGGEAGGLVGYASASVITASYATGAVSVTGTGSSSSPNKLGGLVGELSGSASTVTASYATGAVAGGSSATHSPGGLVGVASNSPTVTGSYWDRSSTGTNQASSGGSQAAAGKTTAELQNPVCYTGDYAGWNVDLDGDGAADQPWYFGGGSDYPVLQYGGHSLAAQGIASRLAELSGLDIAPGLVYGDFLHCPMEYRAVAGPAVTEITVSPTAADGVTPTYQDGNDNALVDSNAGTDGQQTPLAAGENTVKVTVAAGRSYVLKVERAAVPTVTGTTQTLAAWATRNGSLDTPAQLSGSTRAAQTLTFSVDNSGGQTPTASNYWATMQVWLCTTQTVDNTRPTAAAGCVNAGLMSNPTPDDTADDNQAQVAAKLTAAQAANGGVVVKVWDTTSPGALQLAQWLPIRLADDAALRELGIAAGGIMRPPFTPARHDYIYYLASGATELTVTHAANHPGATVAYQDGDGNGLTDADTGTDGFQIPVGSANGAVSAFAVAVTAADTTTTQRYAVTVSAESPPGLVIAASPLVVRDGGAGSYTVALDTQPSAAVTVSISRQARTGGGVGEAQIRVGSSGSWEAAATLEFTTANWNTPQTVSVQAPADADTTDETDTFTHRVAATTTNALEYRGVTASLTVDIKEAAIILDPATALTLAEGASAAAAYTVKLAAPPSDTVTVTVARSSGLGEVEFSAAAAGTYAGALELSFTTENWDTAQTVYVKAGADDDYADDSGNITHTASGGGYGSGGNSVSRNRATTVTDPDSPGLVINPTTLDMGEGADATYTVKLAKQPAGPVTVSIARTGSTDVTLDAAASSPANFGASQDLDFTTGNWNDVQTVNVRAATDADNADDTATLTHTTTAAYGSLSATLTVNVLERGIILNPADALSLTENGAAASYTVALSRQPTGTVAVAVASANGDLEFSTNGGSSYAATRSLSFSTGSGVAGGWDRAQTVYVRAKHDADGQDETATITHTPSGGGYSVARNRSVTIADDDLRLVHTGLGTGNALTVPEGGTRSFTVRLGSAPAGSVMVAIAFAAGASPDITLDTAALTFGASADPGNEVVAWNVAQTVTVSAAADSDRANDTARLTFALTSTTDSDYPGLRVSPVAVTVPDTLGAGLSVNPRTLSVPPGSSRTYNIRLTAPPSNDVTVTPAASDDSGLTITPATALTFTGSDWETGQTVTVEAPAGTPTGTATINHTLVSDDTYYDEQTFAAGDVTVNINNAPAPATGGGFGGGGSGGSGGGGSAAPAAAPPDIEFSVASIAMDEGMAAAYRVRLSAAPVGAATVTIASSSSGVTATPASLDFTDAWDQWQTVLITAARDRNSRDATARLTHRGPEGSRGVLEVAIADIWPEALTQTVNGHTLTVTYTQDAPYGVTATAPETLAADATVTVSEAPEDTPPTPLAYGLGEGAAAPAHISVSGTGTGTDGLTICLPAVSAATAAAATVEGDDPPPALALLRYTAAAGWQPVENAEVVADADSGMTTVCAAGITGEGVYAAAYPLPPLGMMSDFTATAGNDPGTVTLTWTPGANANLHFIAGVSRADLDAGRYVFAIWNWSDETDSHTYTDLDSGVLYYITAIAGRYFPARDQAQWSAWVNWQLATPN